MKADRYTHSQTYWKHETGRGEGWRDGRESKSKSVCMNERIVIKENIECNKLEISVIEFGRTKFAKSS